jgi:hypothetical protein
MLGTAGRDMGWDRRGGGRGGNENQMTVVARLCRQWQWQWRLLLFKGNEAKGKPSSLVETMMVGAVVTIVVRGGDNGVIRGVTMMSNASVALCMLDGERFVSCRGGIISGEPWWYYQWWWCYNVAAVLCCILCTVAAVLYSIPRT